MVRDASVAHLRRGIVNVLIKCVMLMDKNIKNAH